MSVRTFKHSNGTHISAHSVKYLLNRTQYRLQLVLTTTQYLQCSGTDNTKHSSFMLKMWENTHIYFIYDDLHQCFSKFKVIYLN